MGFHYILNPPRILSQIAFSFVFFYIKVNTKYLSSRELKTWKFSLVLRTCENADVFNTLDEIYLVFIPKK